MRVVEPGAARTLNLCADVVDTHLSEWSDGQVFQKYKREKRPFAAFFFLLSDMRLSCDELDENGAVTGRVIGKKGDILYLPPGVFYQSSFAVPPAADGKKARTVTVNFNLTDARGEEILFGERPFFLENRVGRMMTDDLLTLHKCTINPSACDRSRINSLFFAILYEATRDRIMDDRSLTIRVAVQAIEEEWNRSERMERYAALCNRSMTCFYQEFKAFTGMSPTKYRNCIRINVAKSDLRNTGMTVREIAAKLGFEDEFYFSRVFRKLTGVSPQKFRRE